MQHQEILSGEPGQVFAFDPPDGRPDRWPAPCVTVSYGDTPIDATTGPCAIDPVETALAADVTAGGTTIRVARTYGFAIGARYRITAANGEFEWIAIARIRDGALGLVHPVVRPYAPGATIVGARISIAVSSAWANDRRNLSDGTVLGADVLAAAPVGAVASAPPIVAGPIGGEYTKAYARRYRRGYAGAPIAVASMLPPRPQPKAPRGLARYVLRWHYFVDGFEMSAISYADLVSVRSEELVTPADVEKRFPGGGDFVADAIHAVRTEAIGDAHAQRKLRDTAVLKELVPARANAIAVEQSVIHGQRRAADVVRAERNYATTYDRLVGQRGNNGDDDDFVPAPTVEPRKPKKPLGKIPKLTRY